MLIGLVEVALLHGDGHGQDRVPGKQSALGPADRGSITLLMNGEVCSW